MQSAVGAQKQREREREATEKIIRVAEKRTGGEN